MGRSWTPDTLQVIQEEAVREGVIPYIRNDQVGELDED